MSKYPIISAVIENNIEQINLLSKEKDFNVEKIYTNDEPSIVFPSNILQIACLFSEYTYSYRID